jgi:hypothetical protein
MNIMKKIILLLVLVLDISMNGYSQQYQEKEEIISYIKRDKVGRNRGYRGFIEGGFGNTYNKTINEYFITSHGYQFNPRIYLGAGFLVYDYTLEGEKDVYNSFFLNFRYTPIDKWVTPFFDIKMGYSIHDFIGNGGMYYNANAGMSFLLTDDFGVNLGIGYFYNFASQKYGYDGTYYSYAHDKSSYGLVVRFGIEF